MKERAKKRWKGWGNERMRKSKEERVRLRMRKNVKKKGNIGDMKDRKDKVGRECQREEGKKKVRKKEKDRQRERDRGKT